MDLTFDISDDELPIFLAEVSEQLEILDEGLVRLERESDQAGLLQVLFRAAHTLKGSAGMIGHKRMVALTHALETVLDGIRKGLISIQTDLIDVCLQSVDMLHNLSDEVSTRAACPQDIAPLLAAFASLGQLSTGHLPSGQMPTAQDKPEPAAVGLRPTDAVLPMQAARGHTFHIQAEISPDSMASAARAFQLMLALHELGEILAMEPAQEQIETASPVSIFKALLASEKPVEAIRSALSQISDIDRLSIGNEQIELSSPVNQAPERPPVKKAPAIRLGDILLENGLITEAQLQAALLEQSRETGPKPLIGKTLVKMGFISQEVLDEVVSEQAQHKQADTHPGETNSEERTKGRANGKTVRTSVERLDSLMNLVGELITDRNRLYLVRSNFDTRFHGDSQVDALSETITHIGRITDQLQSEVMSIRMLPVANVFNKFPRLVRDLARKANKQVDLVIRGEDTELDRSVIEEISDPLIHLLRNAVDHGLELPAERLAAGKLERGSILVTARYEQGRIIVTVEDDGRGLDLERVKAKAVDKGLIGEKEASGLSEEEVIDLIFVSGLSTAKKVSDVSGRGVGMDIVRNNIERLNGNILVETWPGRGTRFQIVLPLTLAIVPTLLVRVGKGTYAIPLVTVIETLRVARPEIATINGRPVILLRDRVLPVIRLSAVFDLQETTNDQRNVYVVVVRSGKSQMGLIVDALVGEQEVVVKSLSAIVGEVTGVSSAAILGDGQVALILDVQGLFKLAGQVLHGTVHGSVHSSVAQ